MRPVWSGLCVAAIGGALACGSSSRPARWIGAADGGRPRDAGGASDTAVTAHADPDASASASSGHAVAGASVSVTSGHGAAIGGRSGGAATPSCTASEDAAQANGTDAFVANTGKQAVTAITYTNVGASGMYAQVVSGWSKATGCMKDSDGSLCENTYRKPKSVSGALAPFDDEMSFVFAGPIELYKLAVYSPADGAWRRDAYWDRCTSAGLAFAGNKSWYECGGFVESYVTADGTKESADPVQFAGSIAAGTEVHVMSSALCSGDECGWSSGLPLHGFKGDVAGSKLFAVELRMPIADKTPAYWILPAQVIRSSQYGCNCRGAGSDPVYKGGCGELDVAEILGGVTTSLEATTTLYSFQDITGGGSVTFARPVHEAAVFLAIFDAPSRQIALRRAAISGFDFASSMTSDAVAHWLEDPGTTRALQ